MYIFSYTPLLKCNKSNEFHQPILIGNIHRWQDNGMGAEVGRKRGQEPNGGLRAKVKGVKHSQLSK